MWGGGGGGLFSLKWFRLSSRMEESFTTILAKTESLHLFGRKKKSYLVLCLEIVTTSATSF